MSIEQQLDQTLATLLANDLKHDITAQQIKQCIDLTLLDNDASVASLALLQEQALANQVAAVCVFTEHLSQFAPLKNSIKLATVVNFPQATQNTLTCLQTIHSAIELGADEIDYLIPYQAFLGGDKLFAYKQCDAIVQECKNHRLTLKIILETGAFPNMATIYELSKELINMGCDFLKTSTGKITQGASLSAALAILSAIKDSGKLCGFKVSGGVKTSQQAFAYAQLAELIMGKRINDEWFRIGASSLINELNKN